MVIDSSKDLNDLFDFLFMKQRSSNYVYRGISRDDELNPSLVRNHLNLKVTINVVEYETELLKKYGKYSMQYVPAYSKPLDWVASAQHYGLPTRLIDWSFDPFCALFFSVFANDKPDGDYYKVYCVDLDKNIYLDEIPIFKNNNTIGINTNNELLDQYLILVQSFFILNSIWGQLHHDTLRNSFVRKVKDYFEDERCTNRQKLFFCSTYDSNPRLIAQKGLFQIPRRFYDKNEKLCIADDIKEVTDLEIRIHKSLRKEIIQFLEKINVNTPRLFPDIGSICNYLRFSEEYS